MDERFFTEIEVEDRSHIAFIKREVNAELAQANISAQKIALVDIVVLELLTNILKHAGHGKLLYRLNKKRSGTFFEVISLDNGPGSNNIQRALQDGVSTTNTLGQGLGAIKRISEHFQIFSMRGWGTVVYSSVRLVGVPIALEKPKMEFGGLQVCYPGEKINGDGYAVRELGSGYLLFIGDGLGHGFNAHHAVSLAIEYFNATTSTNPSEILAGMHKYVKNSRGLVANVAYFDLSQAAMTICGVGNISVRMVNGIQYKNFNNYNGIIGMNFPSTLVNSHYKLNKHDIFVAQSDGIQNKWSLASLSGLLKFDAQVISAAIYKNFARGNDDMTIMTAKIFV